MNPMPNLKFQGSRFSAFIAAGILVAVGLLIGITSEAVNRSQQLKESSIQAATLAEGVAAALMFNDSAAALETANALAVNPKIDAVGLYQADGKRIGAYKRSNTYPPLALPTIQSGSAFKGAFVEATAPVQRDGQVYGAVFVRVGQDPLLVRLGRYVPVGLLILMATLVLIVAGAAQTALRRANAELGIRANDLSAANALLKEEMDQRKNAEEALLQSRKMEAIGQLTGGVAHDFNNLLMVIAGGLRLIEKQERGSDRWIKTVNGMRQAVDRGSGLTRQLLAFSRRQPMKVQTIDVERQIVGMHELLERSLRADILMEMKVSASLPHIETDPGLLELAILNLCVNARDAMPKGGLLTISARSPEPKIVEIVVSDTGTGIPPDVLERIFEPYFTTKAQGQGTGLGMSQVYGFAQQSGGSVRIETALNVGTSVILSLPASDRPLVQASAEMKSEQREEKRRKILVVEDDDQVAETVCNMLEEIGHVFTRARSANEALHMLESGPNFDLVFSDIIMPGGKSGLELSSELKQKLPELPVLLTTGYSGNQEVDPGRPLLRKPYELQELRDAISALPL